MDVRQLTYYAHPAQFKSISAAAAYLNVAQPELAGSSRSWKSISTGRCSFATFPLVAAWPKLESDKLNYARICNPTLVRPLLLATLPAGLSAACRVVAQSARQEFFDLLQGKRWRTTK